MTALTQALDAAQAKAITALGKSYIRRADDPDDSIYAASLAGLGVDDELGVQFLLAAWAVLREQREQPPGLEPMKQYYEAQPATEAQLARIRRDCNAKGLEEPNKPLTKAEASRVIELIAEGKYDGAEWTVPF